MSVVVIYIYLHVYIWLTFTKYKQRWIKVNSVKCWRLWNQRNIILCIQGRGKPSDGRKRKKCWICLKVCHLLAGTIWSNRFKYITWRTDSTEESEVGGNNRKRREEKERDEESERKRAENSEMRNCQKKPHDEVLIPFSFQSSNIVM